jgi:hypothetical protein
MKTAKWHAEALVVGLDGVTQANLRSIAELAAKQRLPSIYPAKDYAKLGGLMTYGSSDFHMCRAAGFVDQAGRPPCRAADGVGIRYQSPNREGEVMSITSAAVLRPGVEPWMGRDFVTGTLVDDSPSPRKRIGGGRYRVAASVVAWLMSCWAASHWPARCVRAVSRTVSALAN